MSIDNGDHARSIMQRILRLQEEVDALKADIREVYAEAKAHGYDKAAMGDAIRIIRKREKDAAGFEERSAIVDLYLAAFDQSSHVHAGARTREQRSKDRLSEAMADNKEFSAELAQAGLISAEAHAENIALSDAVAVKLGSGVAKPLRPHCKNPDNCGGYGSTHCFRCRPEAA